MADSTVQRGDVWALARRQHGVVTRAQLRRLGYTPAAILHRLRTARLHPLWRGVYAVGRPETSRAALLLGAVLACGPDAVLSHGSAAELWGLGPRCPLFEVSVPLGRAPQRPGICAHRRRALNAADVTRRDRIPVTRPARTLLDLAARLDRRSIEAAIDQADRLGLVDPDRLRAYVNETRHQPGMVALREILDLDAFVLTDSQLERDFLRIVDAVGLPRPITRARVNGYRVDFHWPELGLVVETDGLRYHRTAAQQRRDRLRDQAHAAAGLTCLRFTHAQVARDRRHVEATLTAVVGRLSAERGSPRSA